MSHILDRNGAPIEGSGLPVGGLIRIQETRGVVFLTFGGPVQSLGLSPPHALSLSHALRECAKRALGVAPESAAKPEDKALAKPGAGPAEAGIVTMSGAAGERLLDLLRDIEKHLGTTLEGLDRLKGSVPEMALAALKRPEQSVAALRERVRDFLK